MSGKAIFDGLMVFPGDLPLIAAFAVVAFSMYEYIWTGQSGRRVASATVRRLGLVALFALGILALRLATVLAAWALLFFSSR